MWSTELCIRVQSARRVTALIKIQSPERRLSLSSMHERWHERHPVYDPSIGFFCAKERQWKQAWRGYKNRQTGTSTPLRVASDVDDGLEEPKRSANHVMARDAGETWCASTPENVCAIIFLRKPEVPSSI